MINIDAGFNSTLRQGNITHHEYFQVCYGLQVYVSGEVKYLDVNVYNAFFFM